MEENMLKDYLEGYVNIHNELVDLDVSDKTKEIEHLKNVIISCDAIIQTYTDRAALSSDENKRRKEFEEGTKEYFEKIKASEKEIEDIKRQQEENKKRKEVLENAQKSIRERARQFKDEKLAEEEENKTNDVLPKMYDYHLKREKEVRNKLEKFKDIELETTKQEVERIQLEKELREIEKDKKTVAQQMNQKSNKSKKIEKDYILFLGQLSLIDKNDKKILSKEEKQEEKLETNSENEKPEENLETNPVNEKPEEGIEETIERIQREFTKANKDYSKVHLRADKEVNETIKSEEKVTYIEISEEDGKITWLNNQKEENQRGIVEAFETQRAKFKRLDIYKKCQEITGGAISGWLLKRKLNPEIIIALEKYDDQLKDYISSIHNNTALPFELVHKFGKVDLKTKIQRNRFAKLERKLGATVLGKLFDKNIAIEEAKKQEQMKDEKAEKETKSSLDDYRDVIDTETQAKNTERILKEQEEKRAKDVQKMKEDEVEKISGDAVLDQNDEVVTRLSENDEAR